MDDDTATDHTEKYQGMIIGLMNAKGNIIFQDISRTKLPLSRTKYTRFKCYESRYVQKSIQPPPPRPFYVFDPPIFT